MKPDILFPLRNRLERAKMLGAARGELFLNLGKNRLRSTSSNFELVETKTNLRLQRLPLPKTKFHVPLPFSPDDASRCTIPDQIRSMFET